MINGKFTAVLIGCGNRGNAHANGISVSGAVELAALCDILPEKAAALNEKYGFGAKEYTDYRLMLREIKPDIAIICLWTGLHVEVLRDCAQAGVRAVHSEKPVAPSWEEYNEAAAIARKHSLLLTYCHQRNYCPHNIEAKRLISDGVFGKIIRMDLYSPPHLLDCGTHTFDQAFSYNGGVPVKRVFGCADMSSTINYFDVRAEKNFVGYLEYENGIHATVKVGHGFDQDSGLRVICDNGFIEVNWEGDIIKAAVYDKPDWVVPAQSEHNDPMPEVIRRIARGLEEGGRCDLDYENALRAGEVIFALYESAFTNRIVELPYTKMSGKNPVDVYQASAK